MPRAPTDLLGSFDYVVVGAGTAGCLLANRLSADPAARVLLLEAGGDDAHGAGGEWRIEEQRLSWEILDAFRAACAEAGIPPIDDFNRGDNAGCGRGRSVNIASISGWRAGTERSRYGTAKAALIQLTRQMARELAPHRITVNAIAPGPVETDMVKAAHAPEQRAAYARMVPLARYGTPAEIAAAALYLVSDDAAYVTGHVLDVDGGFMAAGLATRDRASPVFERRRRVGRGLR